MVVRATHAANQRGGWWVNLRMQRLFLNMPEPVLPLTWHWASRALRGTRRFTCWATSSAHFTIIGYQLKSGQNPGGDVLSISIRKKADPLQVRDLKDLRSWQTGRSPFGDTNKGPRLYFWSRTVAILQN